MSYAEMMKMFNDYLASTTPEAFYEDLKEANEGILGSWANLGIDLADSPSIYNPCLGITTKHKRGGYQEICEDDYSLVAAA